MEIIKTKIKDLVIVKSTIYKDKRGFLKETFNNKLFKNKSFPFDIMSYSKKGVLRGLHIQTTNSQAKYLTVTQGKIFDVAVDLRKGSKTFGHYESVVLSDKGDISFYIPEGFAHGFMCLSDTCTVNYKCSNYRHAKSEKTLSWNDRMVGIKWPNIKPILSDKDKNGLKLKNFL